MYFVVIVCHWPSQIYELFSLFSLEILIKNRDFATFLKSGSGAC